MYTYKCNYAHMSDVYSVVWGCSSPSPSICHPAKVIPHPADGPADGLDTFKIVWLIWAASWYLVFLWVGVCIRMQVCTHVFVCVSISISVYTCMHVSTICMYVACSMSSGQGSTPHGWLTNLLLCACIHTYMHTYLPTYIQTDTCCKQVRTDANFSDSDIQKPPFPTLALIYRNLNLQKQLLLPCVKSSCMHMSQHEYARSMCTSMKHLFQ
jgi:hypothetical protein